MTPLSLFLLAGEDLGVLLWLASIAYLALALWQVARFAFAVETPGAACPPMTVLKPLCGAEPGLEANLRSFCEQDYPAPLQIIFGVGHAGDPALATADRLARAYPGRDIAVVVSDAMVGPNPKVSNLANMAALAKYELLVISDSDAAIESGCLRQVGAAFDDPTVGAVTCLFRGAPADPASPFDRLGALYTNAWTLPSAVVAAALAPLGSCDGPLTAIRRQVIEAEGGFRALSHLLGDDGELGAMTLRHGLRVVVGPAMVRMRVTERDLPALFSHEVRWARTTRAASPVAYAASGVTWSLPLVGLLLLLHPSAFTVAAIALQVALRTALAALTQARLGGADSRQSAWPWTIAARECLCFAVWAAGFFGRHVSWRGQSYRFGPGGRLVGTGAWDGWRQEPVLAPAVADLVGV